MAELVLTNAYCAVGGVDLSDHVRRLTLTYEAGLLDATAMGDGTRRKLGGLKDWSLEVEFNQDFAAGAVDATLFPLVGTAVVIEVRAVNASRSATNPGYTGTGVLESYPPLGGAVGEMATARAMIRAAGDLARSTT